MLKRVQKNAPKATFALEHHILIFFSVLLSSTTQAAGWDPDLTAIAGDDPSGSGEGASKILTVDWIAPASFCTDVSSYMLRWDKSAVDATDTTSGEFLVRLPALVTQYQHMPLHADTTYHYAIYGCDEAASSSTCTICTNHLAADAEASGETDQEEWELVGITDENDYDSAITSNSSSNAPHVVFMSNDWSETSLRDHALLYYSESFVASEYSDIYLDQRTSAGWPTTFNDTNWEGVTAVAKGNETSTNEAYLFDHPWVMLTDDGSDHRVQLMGHGRSTDFHVVQVESDDDQADSFACSGGSCNELDGTSYGYIAIDPNGGTGTDTQRVEDAGHGRIMYNYIGQPLVTLSDTPVALVTMTLDSTCSSYNTDIVWVDGAWNSSTPQWDWTVRTSLATNCPVIAIENAHDPGYIPYPNNEMKVVHKDGATHKWELQYCDISNYTCEDESEVLMFWDSNSSTGPSPECAENVTGLAHVDLPDKHEGYFFYLWDLQTCWTNIGSGTCISFDATYNSFDDGANDYCGGEEIESRIVYAELRN